MTMNMENSNEAGRALSDEIVRAYADGKTSWREIRSQIGVEDFNLMLGALGALGLRLPRAPADRPSQAKAWMAAILAEHARAA